MYNLASTMLNTLEEVKAGSKRTSEEQFIDADLLLECDHVPEMKERMKQMLAQVCDWILAEKRNHHRYLIEDVSQYVQEHLYDPKLNISMIGDAFQMTPLMYQDCTRNLQEKPCWIPLTASVCLKQKNCLFCKSLPSMKSLTRSVIRMSARSCESLKIRRHDPRQISKAAL